jgi:subtilisin family serine protease
MNAVVVAGVAICLLLAVSEGDTMRHRVPRRTNASVSERYVPGKIIVKLTPACRGQVNPAILGRVSSFGIPELDELNSAWHVKKITYLIRDPHPNDLAKKYGLDLLYLLDAESTADVPAMVAAYAQCPKVTYTCPDAMMPLDEVPNDPRYPNQWHLAKIEAPGAWDVSHGDASVIIGVVDDGVDYYHPDIARNLWINSAEDINGNGQFDPYPPPEGDLDGLDNDGNGYIDDVIGYDWVNDDPDPMPVGGDEHGTHCWGVTNAVTNNDTGVASIGWGCRGMGLKAGQGGSVYLNAACAAIYYAVEKGAWVTSHSYGGLSEYGPLRDAMQYAWDVGEIICAAAGNDNSTQPHYPGASDMCVGVSASDAADHRCSWSNYGDWVEVASPGTGILSTVPDSGYTVMDGTSMATPLVAGLCALIKAANPGMTNQDVLDRLYSTCDTMPDPDYRAGLLGHGRINAMKALAMAGRSYLTLAGQHLNDPNHNGIPEPGELVGLTVTLNNAQGWQTATSVSATLTCSDPDITVIKNGATFPDIPAGSSGSCAADSFVFSVNANAVPHRVTFRIDKTATPASLAPSDNLTMEVGIPRILLVDDRAGDDIAKWYRWACDSLRALYHQYSTAASGAPSADTLRDYPVVIWFTGLDSTNLLSAACQTALASYLDNHGKLFISGQNVGQAIGSSSFYSDYLRAQLDTTSTGKLFTLGLPGDPIGNGDTIVCGGAGGAGNARSCDGIKPINGAFGSIIYKDFPDTTVYGAIRYLGDFKLVYFAEPFEAIDHATPRYVQKWTILRRIMDYFGEPLPGAVTEINPMVEKIGAMLRVSPNPATGQAAIEWSLGTARPAQARIYDIRGRLVRTISFEAGPGLHRIVWNLRDQANRTVAPGVYVCTVTSGGDSRTGKILVTR